MLKLFLLFPKKFHELGSFIFILMKYVKMSLNIFPETETPETLSSFFIVVRSFLSCAHFNRFCICANLIPFGFVFYNGALVSMVCFQLHFVL